MAPAYVLPQATQRLCRVLSLCVLALTIGGIALVALTGAPQLPVDAALAALPPFQRAGVTMGPEKMILLQAIGWANGLALLIIPLGAFGVFSSFASGQVFDPPAVRAVRRLGWSVVVASLVRLLVPSMMAAALTFDSGPGRRFLTLTLDSNHVVLLMIGLTVLIVGQVYVAAARIAGEHGQIV